MNDKTIDWMAYKCTRCKRYFDGLPNKVLAMPEKVASPFAPDTIEYALCPDCFDGFKLYVSPDGGDEA